MTDQNIFDVGASRHITYYAVSRHGDDCDFLPRNYRILDPDVGQGAYGKIYQLCNNATDNCDYILKESVYDVRKYEMVGVERGERLSLKYIEDIWINEVLTLLSLNACQERSGMKFSPTIYDYWFCEAYEGGRDFPVFVGEEKNITFYILMEKFDGNLQHFIKRYKSDNLAKAVALLAMKNLELQLRHIHQTCEICLNDIKPENILFKKLSDYEYEFVFADTGLSKFDAPEECIREDLRRFQDTIEKFKYDLQFI